MRTKSGESQLKPAPIDNEVIELMKSRRQAWVLQCRRGPEPGDRVRIKDGGPWRAIVGVIERNTQLLTAINYQGRLMTKSQLV
jgi:hypothetical protein